MKRPRRTTVLAVFLRSIVLVAVLAGSAACMAGPDNSRPNPDKYKLGELYPLPAADQEKAASETDGTTTVLLANQFWPVAQYKAADAPWRTVFVPCTYHPSDTARDECIKRAGAGTFDAPRIERVALAGPPFVGYRVARGPFTFKAGNVSCTSKVKAYESLVPSMHTVAQAYRGKKPGTYQGPPGTGSDEPDYACEVTKP